MSAVIFVETFIVPFPLMIATWNKLKFTNHNIKGQMHLIMNSSSSNTIMAHCSLIANYWKIFPNAFLFIFQQLFDLLYFSTFNVCYPNLAIRDFSINKASKFDPS